MKKDKYSVRPFEKQDLPERYLNIRGHVFMTKVHGPGKRFSVWMQGCLKICPECVNPCMKEPEKGNKILASSLLDHIQRARDGVLKIEGITLQGGEPMLQARNLIPVLEKVTIVDSPALNILLFTGYTLEYLQEMNNSEINDVLAMTDTLIDGPFEKNLIDKTYIRGSINQGLWHRKLDGTFEKSDFGNDVLSEEQRTEYPVTTLKGRDFRRKGTEINVGFSSGGIKEIRTGIDVSHCEES